MSTENHNIQLPFTNSHAFIIGINDYEHLSPLSTAVKDAEVLAQQLAESHDYQVHGPLLNASKADLLNLLKKDMPQIVGSKDRVLFYFAGHGIALDSDDNPKGYLVPVDAEPGNTDTLLAMDVLHQAFTNLPCKHGLLIMDCCFAGAFKWSTGFRDIVFDLPAVIYEERFYQYASDPAWQVITSSASDQKAVDILSNRTLGMRNESGAVHSPFAQALLDGINGEADTIPKDRGDGVITATELYTYLRDRVEDETMGEGKRQSPSMFSLSRHDKGQFIFLHPRHPLNLPPIPDRNPFMGLKSYNESDTNLFYGRDRVINALEGIVAQQPLVVVSGASGTGKSSVIKAGLLPNLRKKDWTVLPVVRPGKEPMRSLQEALPGMKLPMATDKPTVLIIDQYEELITQCQHPEERDTFEAQLSSWIQQNPSLRIMISIRSDFEPQFEEGGLANWWQAGRYVVPAFSQDELREVIIKPTIQEVLFFEPDALVDNLVDAVNQAPGALPLLSFTLSELYHAYLNSGRTNRSLSLEDYEKLGGVIGALRTRANSIYDGLDTAAQNSMRKLMLRMISLEGGELASRRVLDEELSFLNEAETLRMKQVAQQLVKARLVSSGTDQQGRIYYEPAHDALVRSWGRLWEWVKAMGEEKLALQYKLNQAVNDYHGLLDSEPKKARRLLWNNNPRLDLLRAELQGNGHRLNAREETFVRSSVKYRSARQRTILAIVLAVIVGLAGLTLYSLQQQSIAKEEIKTAEERLVISESNRLGAEAQIALDGAYYAEALQKSLAAFHLRKDSSDSIVQRALSESFSKYLNYPLLFPKKRFVHESAIQKIWMDSAERMVATYCEDGILTIWDIANHKQLQQVRLDYIPKNIHFSPNGNRLLIITKGLQVVVWDLPSGEFKSLDIPNADKVTFSFLEDNETIFVGKNMLNSDPTVIEWWNWRGGKIRAVNAADWIFKLDDQRLVRHDGKKVIIMNLFGQPIDQFDCPSMLNVNFSDDKNTVFILQSESKELRSGAYLWKTNFHYGTLRNIKERTTTSLFPINDSHYKLSPKGNFLASGELGNVRIFKADGTSHHFEDDHGGGREYAICFAPDESEVFYFIEDGGTMKVWQGPYVKSLRYGIEGRWEPHFFAAEIPRTKYVEKAVYLTNENIHVRYHNGPNIFESVLSKDNYVEVDHIKAIHNTEGVMYNAANELLDRNGALLMSLNTTYQQFSFFESRYGFCGIPQDSTQILTIWEPLFEKDSKAHHSALSTSGNSLTIKSKCFTDLFQDGLHAYTIDGLEHLHIAGEIESWLVEDDGIVVLTKDYKLKTYSIDDNNKWVEGPTHKLDFQERENFRVMEIAISPDGQQLLANIRGPRKGTRVFDLNNNSSTFISGHYIKKADDYYVYLSPINSKGYTGKKISIRYNWETRQQNHQDAYYLAVLNKDTLIDFANNATMMNDAGDTIHVYDKTFLTHHGGEADDIKIETEMIPLGELFYLSEDYASPYFGGQLWRHTHLWDIKTNQYLLSVGQLPSAFHISEDKKHLLMAFGRDLQIWDVEQKQRLQTISHEHTIIAVDISVDKQVLLIGDESGMVREWTIDGSILSETMIPDDFSTLKLLPGNEAFLSFSYKNVYQWYLPKGLYQQYHPITDLNARTFYLKNKPSAMPPHAKARKSVKPKNDVSGKDKQSSEQTTSLPASTTLDYEQIIRDFMEAEDERNMESIKAFYASTVKRYWELDAPKLNEIIKKYESAWERSYSSQNNITQIESLGNNRFVIHTDFTFQSQAQNEPTTVSSKVQLVFDDEGKIIEIYGVN